MRPNPVERQKVYYQINVNLLPEYQSPKHLEFFLRNKLKGFLYNSYSTMMNRSINSHETCLAIFKTYCQQSAYKILVFLNRAHQEGHFSVTVTSQSTVNVITWCLHDIVLLSCW